jgi:hypothetical protein
MANTSNNFMGATHTCNMPWCDDDRCTKSLAPITGNHEDFDLGKICKETVLELTYGWQDMLYNDDDDYSEDDDDYADFLDDLDAASLDENYETDDESCINYDSDCNSQAESASSDDEMPTNRKFFYN